ncbi:unnamed protein product [Lactuca virosa]|uniref:Uncharacterized protein n=1 Tax=Lactuca virosa TaxID=75947 RepID=A0AAU9MXH4_9ASTR|nr:unnamed protein product [Lactuca virosa]
MKTGANWQPSWETRRVTNIQGSLAVISTKGDKSWIWIRRDASWSVVYKLEKNKVGEGVMEVLQLNNNCDLLLRTYSHGLQVYNPKTGAGSRRPGLALPFIRMERWA